MDSKKIVQRKNDDCIIFMVNENEMYRKSLRTIEEQEIKESILNWISEHPAPLSEFPRIFRVIGCKCNEKQEFFSVREDNLLYYL